MQITQTQDFPEAIYEVTVSGKITTQHNVALTKNYHQKLTAGKISPEELIKKSFEFLLAREPNTSILSKFDLDVISTYFPEYEKEITQNLSPQAR
jgi:hypothetical protein